MRATLALAAALAMLGPAAALAAPAVEESRRGIDQADQHLETARRLLAQPPQEGRLPSDGVREAETAVQRYERALDELQTTQKTDAAQQAIRNARAELLATRQALQQPGDPTGQRAALQALDDIAIAMREVEQASADDLPPPRTAPVADGEAERLIGRPARTADGGRLGPVDGVLRGPDGRAQAAVIDVGPYFGTPRREVAIDWNSLRLGESAEVVVELNRDQLAEAPVYEPPGR